MLPASHIGSKRYMQQNFHDCMAICCVYGPPDKFTTFTYNSKWPEITEALRFEAGQTLLPSRHGSSSFPYEAAGVPY